MIKREAAVAGHFYPSDPGTLKQLLSEQLASIEVSSAAEAKDLKALIVPHAGYIYSGPTAAFAYNILARCAVNIKRVLLLGLSHRIALAGIAASSASVFTTPLGDIPVDTETIGNWVARGLVTVNDHAHQWEHSLEVQLPFLQSVLPSFTLLPLATGDCTLEQVEACIEPMWFDDTTLIVISSDLSHFLPYSDAQIRDQHTCNRILQSRDDLSGEDACGSFALNGLAQFLKKHAHSMALLDYRNSGDTAGDKDRVVGYASFAIYKEVD